MEKFPDQSLGYMWKHFLRSPFALYVEWFPDRAFAFPLCGKIIWSSWGPYVDIFPVDPSWEAELPDSNEVRSRSQAYSVQYLTSEGAYVEWFSVVIGCVKTWGRVNKREDQVRGVFSHVEWFPVKKLLIQHVKKRILGCSEINMWRVFLIDVFQCYANQLIFNE